MLWKLYDWYDDLHDPIFKLVLKLLWFAVALVPLWFITVAQSQNGWWAKNGLIFVGVLGSLVILTSRPYYSTRRLPSRRRVSVSTGDFLWRWGLTLVAFFVAGIPLWIFLGLKNIANPEGFWQNIVLYGVGIYFLGIIQLIFFFGLCAVTVSLWEDTSRPW